MILPTFVQFHHVSFTYPTALSPLFQDISIHFTMGWSGIVGANGTGKTTLLKLATGFILPDVGYVEAPSRMVYCEQRTDEPPAQLADLLCDTSKATNIIRSQLGVQDNWITRWQTLSHGERKRAQIAVALWLEPEVLAIDEPTNHIDSVACAILLRALQRFQGVGLLVSHDRALLDTLCQQCLFIDPPNVIMRPGNYSKGCLIGKQDEEAVQKQRSLKKQSYQKIHREVGHRRDLANQYHSKRSKKGIPKNDHDAKQKIDMARISGKDIVGGKLMRQLEGRLKHAKQELESIHVKKQYTLGIWLPGSISNRNLLFQHEPGSLSMSTTKKLTFPQLAIRSTDRIALTGANGTGKTTLLRWLIPQLNVPTANLTYLPQEIEMSESLAILAELRTLTNEQLGHIMTIISRLGSRPHRLLESSEPSPGEIRKLLLALGMIRLPHIIIMDEPTNHLDLPSIECLESALSDCPCALLLVSHDQRFLHTLTKVEWRLTPASETSENSILQCIHC